MKKKIAPVKNRVNPTALQRKAFQNIKRGMVLKDAMIQAGFSEKSAENPKQNLVDRPGFKALILEYRDGLKKAGITKEVLAEIQAEVYFRQ